MPRKYPNSKYGPVPRIHNDHTFDYQGYHYLITRGADMNDPDWDGYIINCVLSEVAGDWVEVEEGLNTMGDVRIYLAKAVREGWPYLPDVDGLNPANPEQEWVLLSEEEREYEKESEKDIRDPNFAALRARLTRLSQDRGLTIEELANLAGINRRTLTYIENGNRQGEVDTWYRLAEALDIKIAELVDAIYE